MGNAARFINTGQAIVDVVLRINALPEPGGDIFASGYQMSPGGDFNVMAAAAREGARVVYAGSIGSGHFGSLVREALLAENVEVLHAPVKALDTGFCVALVDSTAERTFISTVGAEGEAEVSQYEAAGATPHDVVYVSGYSLVHPRNRAALCSWLPRIDSLVIVDPSPVIADVDEEAFRAVLRRADVWTTNAREAQIVAERLGMADCLPKSFARGEELSEAAQKLAKAFGCTVILRSGSIGVGLGTSNGSIFVPPLKAEAVDSNGAGDAHTGVLAANLAAGRTLGVAAARAGIAAAMAVTKEGPATSPNSEETSRAYRDWAAGLPNAEQIEAFDLPSAS